MIREARMGDVDRLMEIWLAGNLEQSMRWGKWALPLRCWCMKMRWAYAAS